MMSYATIIESQKDSIWNQYSNQYLIFYFEISVELMSNFEDLTLKIDSKNMKRSTN